MSSIKCLKVVMIDNQDSFTFNLVDELKQQDCELRIFQNYVNPEIIESLYQEGEMDMLLLSPGPGNPDTAGCCLELVHRLRGKVVIAGICLGHQTIIQALGGDIGKYSAVVHGKSSAITHNGTGLFKDLDSPLNVARYHSLSAQEVPSPLISTAEADGITMAVADEEHGLYGLQFHPESILTIQGQKILNNLIHVTKHFQEKKHATAD